MKIKNYQDLEKNIKYLNWKKDMQEDRLIVSAKEFYSAMQPENIMSGLVKKISYSYSFINKIPGAILGISSGIMMHKLIKNKRRISLVKKVMVRVMQLVVTGFVAKNSNKIKAISLAVVKNI